MKCTKCHFTFAKRAQARKFSDVESQFHHHSLTNYQSPFSKHILKRSLSFCTSRIHAHRTCGENNNAIVFTQQL